jgi:hypothetical protein
VRRRRVGKFVLRNRPNPALGEAVRLLAFARLLAHVEGVTEEESRDLSGPGRLGGQLFQDTLLLGLGRPPRSRRLPASRIQCWVWDGLIRDPARRWPSPASLADLHAVLDRVWRRLCLIWDPRADLAPLVAELNAGPSGCRLRFAGSGRVTRRGPFPVEDTDDAGTLAAHMDDLFIRSAPVWSRFVPCDYCLTPCLLLNAGGGRRSARTRCCRDTECEYALRVRRRRDATGNDRRKVEAEYVRFLKEHNSRRSPARVETTNAHAYAVERLRQAGWMLTDGQAQRLNDALGRWR